MSNNFAAAVDVENGFKSSGGTETGLEAQKPIVGVGVGKTGKLFAHLKIKLNQIHRSIIAYLAEISERSVCYIEYMRLVELDAKKYRKFEQGNSYGNLYQMAERAEVRARMGWKVQLLGCEKDDKIIAGCLVLQKKGMMMVPMGGVLDWKSPKLVSEWLEALKEVASEQGCTTLEVFPPVKLSVRDVKGEILEDYNCDDVFNCFEKAGFKYEGKTTAIENKANRWVVVKDLSKFKNVDELRASYKKNVRNKLRKCSPALEIIEVTDDEGLEKVAFAIEGSNDKNGVKSRDNSYYRFIRDAYGDQVHFVLARRKEDGATVAGRVIFDHPNETVSFISGTVQKYRQMNAMTVLQDDLLSKCLEKGVKRVNFYGIEGDFSEKNRLLEFKSGFDVQVEELIGGFRYVVNPEKYRMEKAMNLIRRVGGKVKRTIAGVVKNNRDRQTHIVRKVELTE